jgi:quercetin dioxygenase-like cupin family protein
MLVLKGTVQIRFPDSGAGFKLRPGSFVHFYAEQEHSAHNTYSEEAHVFIIRSYMQTPVPNVTRQGMRRQLWDHLSREETDEQTAPVDDLTWGWVLEAAAGRSIKDREKVPGEVLNRLGLARLLAMLPNPTPANEADFLTSLRFGTGKEFKSLADWRRRLARGQVKIPRALIPAMHQYFQVSDLLMWEYLFPGIPWRVAVTRHPAKGMENDWIRLSEIPAVRVTDGVSYEIPRRSLACSDLAIAWLTLSPGTGTPWNRHRGCELAIPVEGEATIEYKKHGDICVVSEMQEIAHYNSEKMHRISNNTDKPVQVFLIRFYSESLRLAPPDPSVD